MHIMLFGGSFDPPHNGHWQIAHEIIKQKIADQLWFIPCYSHPFAKNLSNSIHRLNMVQYLTNHAILVNDYEIKKEGTSFSYNTLKHFQTSQSTNTFSWLIGSDQLSSFHKWKNYQEFLKSAKVYIYPRANYPLKPLYENMIPLTDFPMITISSTQVREAVSQNKAIDKLVPEKVKQYIESKNLYKMSY